MTTIHLSDAQRDTFAACGLIVIDGERIPCLRPGCGPPYGYCSRDQFVAPEGWRILTEPCDECDGNGFVCDNDGCPNCHPIVCPSGCDDGRRVVTLTATCPDCSGSGWVAPFDEACDCDHGVVTLGRFTIPALLPVVEFFGDQPAARVNTAGPLIYLAAKGPSPEGAETVEWSGGPLPRSGQFIARPERVE